MKIVAYPGVTQPMQRLSDFTFLAYEKMCSQDPGDTECMGRLQWVLHDYVTNWVCGLVIDKAWTFDGSPTPDFDSERVPAWPGKQLRVETTSPLENEGAEALIGCPNGYGTAYMLLQHEAQLGPRNIDSENIYGNDNGKKSLAWHITPV